MRHNNKGSTRIAKADCAWLAGVFCRSPVSRAGLLPCAGTKK